MKHSPSIVNYFDWPNPDDSLIVADLQLRSEEAREEEPPAAAFENSGACHKFPFLFKNGV